MWTDADGCTAQGGREADGGRTPLGGYDGMDGHRGCIMDLQWSAYILLTEQEIRTRVSQGICRSTAELHVSSSSNPSAYCLFMLF